MVDKKDEREMTEEEAFEKVWKPCIVCGAQPTVKATEMCGPCTFGETATADGNW